MDYFREEDYISGNEIKKKYFAYWLTEYPFELMENLPDTIYHILSYLYVLISLAIPIYIIHTFLDFVNPSGYILNYGITAVSFFVYLYLIQKSLNKLKVEKNKLIYHVKTKLVEEFKVYSFLLLDLYDEYFDSESTEKKVTSLEEYFVRISLKTGIKVDKKLLRGLLKIHFNTDYNKEHNYSTERIHPFFIEIIKKYKKDLSGF